MAVRLNLMTGQYTQYDQPRFLKKYHINDNIQKDINITNFSEVEQVPMMLYFLDTVEAFDCIEWLYIKHISVYMDFKEKFRKWMNMCFKE